MKDISVRSNDTLNRGDPTFPLEDKSIFLQVENLKANMEDSGSSYRDELIPDISVGSFQDSHRIDSMINKFLNENKKSLVKLSAEAENLAIKTFCLFKTNKENLVDEENFVNHWTGL